MLATTIKIETFWILITCTCMLFGKNTSGKTITVKSNHKDDVTTASVSISECSNLPPNQAGHVSSVNTHNKCARFYSERDCKGEDAIELLAHSPKHFDLKFWKFDSKAHSVGPCLNECDTRVTGKVPTQPFTITGFTRKFYKGTQFNLTVDGCTLVPTKYKHTFSSVKVYGQCVQFWTNITCTSMYQSGEYIWDTIELRIGSPQHENIVTGWTFPEVGAVSHCSNKCKNNTVTVRPSDNSLPESIDVILYDNIDFSGNKHAFKLNTGTCLNLDGDWEGTAVSVKTHANKCIILYDQWHCEGNAFTVYSHNANLIEHEFDGVTRSMRYCGLFGSKLTEGGVSERYGFFLTPTEIVVVVVVLLLILGISGGIVFQMIRRMQQERRLSEREIRKFLTGFEGESNDRDNGIQISSRGESSSSIQMTREDGEAVALNMPYNRSYEVKRDNFSMECTIGAGQFGVVCKGTLIHENEEETRTVAVKTLKASASLQDLRCLMKEAKVMLYIAEFGQHPNIVSVVGCCTEFLQSKGDLFILMEYCCNGSLVRFMQNNKRNFCNIIRNGRMNRDKVLHYKRETSEKYFDNFQQLKWMLEVALGMEFLTEAKIVHRDLASRNILLDEKFSAKISDFGLSRKMYNYTSYLRKGNDPLPWKWLALESLINGGEFSTKSDVWSYGVLCWEIFTLGEEPFAGEICGMEFINRIEYGHRLTKPQHCIDECYHLMQHCWNKDPSDRPSFLEITQKLKKISKILQTNHLVSDKILNQLPMLKKVRGTPNVCSVPHIFASIKRLHVHAFDLKDQHSAPKAFQSLSNMPPESSGSPLSVDMPRVGSIRNFMTR